jgi:hypothetical protein
MLAVTQTHYTPMEYKRQLPIFLFSYLMAVDDELAPQL